MIKLLNPIKSNQTKVCVAICEEDKGLFSQHVLPVSEVVVHPCPILFKPVSFLSPLFLYRECAGIVRNIDVDEEAGMTHYDSRWSDDDFGYDQLVFCFDRTQKLIRRFPVECYVVRGVDQAVVDALESEILRCGSVADTRRRLLRSGNAQRQALLTVNAIDFDSAVQHADWVQEGSSQGHCRIQDGCAELSHRLSGEWSTG